MKRYCILLGIILLFSTSTVMAKGKKTGDANWRLNATVGLLSDYIWRGVSQTNAIPAAQSGYTLTHSCGVDMGIWGSNITADKTSLEVDVFAGYSGTLSGLNYRIGGLLYY